MGKKKHYKGTYQAVKDNMRAPMKPSKMCKRCVNTCTNYSIGELVYCRNYVPSGSKDKNGKKIS